MSMSWKRTLLYLDDNTKQVRLILGSLFPQRLRSTPISLILDCECSKCDWKSFLRVSGICRIKIYRYVFTERIITCRFPPSNHLKTCRLCSYVEQNTVLTKGTSCSYPSNYKWNHIQWVATFTTQMASCFLTVIGSWEVHHCWLQPAEFITKLTSQKRGRMTTSEVYYRKA